MSKYAFAIGITTVAALLFAGSARAQNIKEGQWAMTMVSPMTGMEEQTATAMADISRRKRP